MPAMIIVDALWRDSGKGKACAHLARALDADLAVRAGVGTNAGASVTTDDGTLIKARQLPTGWLNSRTRVAVGSGVLVDPDVLVGEIERFDLADCTLVDGRCAVITAEHIAAECAISTWRPWLDRPVPATEPPVPTSCSGGPSRSRIVPSSPRTSATSPSRSIRSRLPAARC